MYENSFTLKRMLAAYGKPLRFSGRSTRTELLGYLIVSALIATMIGYLAIGAGMAGLDEIRVTSGPNATFLTMYIANLLFWLPFPALAVRRFHDQNKSGWWAAPLIVSTIISWLGAESVLNQPVRIILVLLYAAALIILFWKPTDDTNRYGPDPRLNPDGVAFVPE